VTPHLATILAFALVFPTQGTIQDREEGPPALPRWSTEITPAHLEVARALREARKLGPAAGGDLLLRITGSGAGAAHAVVDILSRARVPETSPEDGPQVVNEAQRDLLLSALARLPAASVEEAMKSQLEQAPEDDRTRLAAIRVLSVVGDASDLARMASLAPRKKSDTNALTHDARDAVRIACTAILKRDPRAWTELPDVVRQADVRAAQPMIESFAAVRDPRSLRALYAIGSRTPALAAPCVTLMSQCSPSGEPDVVREALSWMQGELRTAPPGYARAILQAMGELDDGSMIAPMIDHLTDPDARVRDTALWALRKVSGLALPADPAPWRSWSAEEAGWHRTVRPRLLQDLTSRDPGKVVAAVRSYAVRRTRRGEIAGEVARVLASPRPDLRRIACEALGQIASPAASPALVDKLLDPEKSVVEAARKALQSISGVEVPPEPSLARAKLGLP